VLEEHSVFILQVVPIVYNPRTMGGRENCAAKNHNKEVGKQAGQVIDFKPASYHFE
jgi:hypothetical protein